MFRHLWFLSYQLYKDQIVIESLARNIPNDTPKNYIHST